MQDLNSVLLEGNITKDAEMKTLPSGNIVGTANIAVGRFYETKDGTIHKSVSFFIVESWNENAVPLMDLGKGSRIKVIGEMKQDRWENDEGEARSMVKVKAERIELITVKAIAA